MNGTTPPTAPIGWIGAGRMGATMAHRLVSAGHDVLVYNRTRAKCEPLAARGARVADTPADLAECGIVFTMVATSDSFEQVVLGENGLLRRPGAAPRILVDCSTVSAEVSARVRAEAALLGTVLLAAPVSGNPKVVRAGKATIAASGPRAAFDEVSPLLRAIAQAVSYVGAEDEARLIKLCHNIFLGVVTQSLAEVTVLAEKGGVDRADFLAFLNDSVMGSVFSRYKTPTFISLDLKPTFTMELLRKDLDLGLTAAESLGSSLPVAELTHSLVKSAIAAGYRDVDFAGLLNETARASGLELKPESALVSDGLEPDAVGAAIAAATSGANNGGASNGGAENAAGGPR